MRIVKLLGILIIAFFMVGLASAITIDNVEADILAPGEEGRLIVTIENNLDDDATDVSLELDLEDLPFTPVGSSTSTADEINEGDDERFGFILRASNDATLGDYQIPYALRYTLGNQPTITRTGVFGMKISAVPEVDFSYLVETPVVGERTNLEVKIINKGFGDLRFAAVKVFPQGYTLQSDSSVYIGNVDSDDFETASFDITPVSSNAKLKALIEYRDFDNNKVIKNIDAPLKIYTRQEALEKGIIERNSTPLYAAIIVILIVFWLIFRFVRKKRRLKKSREG